MQENNLIRTMVRGSYDLQKIRIQMGNRITGNFKAKLGMTQDGMSEKELAKAEKKILDTLRASYRRITDGIVTEGGAVEGKLPTAKKFKGDEIISTYTELVLVDQYMTLLRDEEAHFAKLGKVLAGIPIYDEFLSDVRGIGPAMAGVIISEIDITKAEYPSSLWKYAGLDAVTIGKYVDDSGKEHIVSNREIDLYFDDGDYNRPMLMHGKYQVRFEQVGRSRRDFCLVERQYKTKEGNDAVRNSITFNPFLKTKLVGVLGTSFLRAGISMVDGKKVGAAKRLELAKFEGFAPNEDSDVDVDQQVIQFLKTKGHDVKVEPSPYAVSYYDYRNRLDNDPRHIGKTEAHKHNMAIRFMVKRFLVDLYTKWRRLEGLHVAPEYSIGKLGMVHKKA